MLIYNRAGRRAWKTGAFALAAAIPFLPVLWLLVQSPAQVWFGIIQYNLLYRLVDWPDATTQNLEVFASWIDSGPAIILTLLAAAGLSFVHFRSTWNAARKAEFYLCAWISVAVAAYLFYVRPTFERYFVFTVPFLSILAVAGIYFLATALDRPNRPWPPVILVTALLTFGLGKGLYDARVYQTWTDFEKLAKQVNAVTAPQQTLYADEAVYFLTRHAPPSGMEMMDSHKFNLPAERLRTMHLISHAELTRMVQAGAFATLETCEDPDDVKEHGYAKPYLQSAHVGDCVVFWGKKP